MVFDNWQGVAPDIKKILETSGLDFGYRSNYAAKIISQFGESEGIELIRRFVEENNVLDISGLNFRLEEHGLERVKTFFDEFGGKSFKHSREILSASDSYGSDRVKEFIKQFGIQNSNYLDSYLSVEDGLGKQVVSEIAEIYGVKFVGIVSPHYQKDRGLVSRVLERFGNRNRYILEAAFKIYPEYEQAKALGGEINQYNITFRGNVQDVGFRGDAETYATICELTGTVRNVRDGSVNAVVQGTNPVVNCFRSSLDDNFRSSSEMTRQEIGECFQSFEVI